MRFKLFTLFLAIQLLSFGVWNILNTSDTVVAANISPSVSHASAEEQVVSPHLSVRNFSNSYSELNKRRKSEIQDIINALPVHHTSSLEKIILDFDADAHRGLGGGSLIILRGIGLSTEEFSAVFIHEIGHVVDLGYLLHKKEEAMSLFKDFGDPVYITDPSLDFYRISWVNDKTRKRNAVNLDFISGYAMTDPFEDFAETYAYYILHGNDFKALTSTSPALYAKWRFMKFRVFDGLEFDMDDGKLNNPNRRVWDVTKLAYDLNSLLQG